MIKLLIGLLFVALGQFQLPQLLAVIKVPSIKIEGEKNYYFMMHSFVAFVLNVLEYLKVPAIMVGLVLLVDSYLLRNIFLSSFLLSASFPWDNKFKLKDPSFYVIIIGALFSPLTLVIIPVIWLLLKVLVKNPEHVAHINVGLVSTVFVLSLYTVYFPTATLALALQVICFTRTQR